MSQITISNGQITMRFIQYVEGETDVVIERGSFIDSYVLTSEEAKEKCRFHMAEHGFKVVNINGVAVKDGKAVNTEKKVASPEKPQKKQTKRFIYCKESKKIWAKEYSRKKAEMMDQIRPYFKDKAVYSQKRAELEASLKDYMKSWESSMADEVNEEIQKHWAEKNAQ